MRTASNIELSAEDKYYLVKAFKEDSTRKLFFRLIQNVVDVMPIQYVMGTNKDGSFKFDQIFPSPYLEQIEKLKENLHKYEMQNYSELFKDNIVSN